MKRILLAAALCLCTAALGSAQQTASDAPATREDVQKYLEVMHSREMMAQMVDAMSKPMHQMFHEQFLKDKDKLPPDFETRMTKMMDDTLKSFPWDEMLESIVPVYQKHFTKGDLGALTAFYSTPDAMKERMQQEVAQMIRDSSSATGKKSQTSPN